MAPTEKRATGSGDTRDSFDKKRRKGNWKQGGNKPGDGLVCCAKEQGRRNGDRKPRRGGPGMLVTCESGREMKCRREVLDILRYYHYRNQSHSDDNGKDSDHHHDGTTTATTDKANGKEEGEGMTLEQELEMLRRGASADEVLHSSNAPKGVPAKRTTAGSSSSPFTPFETGCKGTVFIMCTLPRCNLIPEVTRSVSSEEETAKNSSNDCDTEAPVSAAKNKRSREETDQESDTVETKKTRVGEHENQTPAVSESETPQLGNTHQGKEETPSFEDTQEEQPPWDPIDTLQMVLDDIKGDDANAPSSRFITRMIPIQATCFASEEEIRIASQRLLERFLLKHARERHAQQTTNGASKDDQAPVRVSYQVAFKRRNCSNVRREQIIGVVGDVVRELGKRQIAEEEQKGAGTEGGDAQPVVFDVDLKNPDYTIQIEVCKTLCGMSVIHRCDEFDNFNLYQIRQKQKQEHDDEEATG